MPAPVTNIFPFDEFPGYEFTMTALSSKKADVTKRVTPHVFRHCYATHLLWAGYDIRTVQELLGHKDINTTMVYLHILHPGGVGVESPLDKLELKQWNVIRP